MSELTVTDPVNPHSLVNIVSPSMATAIKCIPESVWLMAEEDLRDAVERITPKQMATIDILREAFWREYDQGSRANRNLINSNVYGGICQAAYFQKEVIGNSFRLAYILTPPAEYEIKMRSLETLGLRKLEEIIRAPVIDKEGNLIPKAAHIQFMVIEQIILRVRGSVPHRMQTENLNMNVEHKTQAAAALPTNMEELDARLRQIEEKTKTDVGQEHEVIDVGQEEKKEE